MATIEEINEDEVIKEGTVESDEEETPELEESENIQPAEDANNQAQEPAEGEVRGKSKQNRSEKKARKAIAKLGLKPFPGVKRVTVKKAKDVQFVITDPEVMKNPSSETYVIFGEAKIEDMNQAAASQAARTFAAPPTTETEPTTAATTEEEPSAENDEEVDETGVSPKDIELVMSQAECSRAKAVEALKKNNNDIVNAIMELTM